MSKNVSQFNLFQSFHSEVEDSRDTTKEDPPSSFQKAFQRGCCRRNLESSPCKQPLPPWYSSEQNSGKSQNGRTNKNTSFRCR